MSRGGQPPFLDGLARERAPITAQFPIRFESGFPGYAAPYAMM